MHLAPNTPFFQGIWHYQWARQFSSVRKFVRPSLYLGYHKCTIRNYSHTWKWHMLPCSNIPKVHILGADQTWSDSIKIGQLTSSSSSNIYNTRNSKTDPFAHILLHFYCMMHAVHSTVLLCLCNPSVYNIEVLSLYRLGYVYNYCSMLLSLSSP